jgi:CheY-like chemotaxis protein
LLRENKGTFVGEIIDLYLFKPLNQERIFELIINLYIEKKTKDNKGISSLSTKEKKSSSSLLTHKVNIMEAKDITQESFKKFKDKHLLIVEDNLINQKVLINILHLSDMKISVVNNGQEAVDIVKEGTIAFDLVLMDINMPIMDGYTATQMIRLDPQFDNLPIVSFTALVLDSEVKKMFNAGINAFLSKPLNIGKLYTVFMMYLTDKSEIEMVMPQVAPKRIFKKYNGIDIEIGIKHSSNSEALYIEVLKEFSEAYGASNQVFTTLVAEHRYAQIKMLCVDMRGITGAIGAKDMSVLSTEILQLILYKKETLLANYTEAYSFELEKLIKAIDGYLLDV